MIRPSTIAAFVAAIVLSALVCPAYAAEPAAYVGSEACAACHRDKHDLWKETLHANVIQDARKHPEVILGDFEKAELPFKKEDVLYTIGSHWDQRYMVRMNDELYVLPKLWSVQSRQWRPYNVFSWNKRPWSRYCAGCHVTGYVTGTSTFAEMRIGCESCHGPGERHATSKAPQDIVDPGKLDKRLRDHICASCHVRGKDLSGEFYFPIGYLPGKDLGDFLVPIDIEEGEAPSAAIDRLYVLWAKDREEKGRGKCEVCGIYGSSDKLKDKMKVSEDVMAYCFKCHEFGDSLANHTRHLPATGLVCLDCHRAKPFTAGSTAADVHSVRYYRIHQDSCYDENVDEACIACHEHKDRDRGWAQDEIGKHWSRVRELDH